MFRHIDEPPKVCEACSDPSCEVPVLLAMQADRDQGGAYELGKAFARCTDRQRAQRAAGRPIVVVRNVSNDAVARLQEALDTYRVMGRAVRR